MKKFKDMSTAEQIKVLLHTCAKQRIYLINEGRSKNRCTYNEAVWMLEFTDSSMPLHMFVAALDKYKEIVHLVPTPKQRNKVYELIDKLKKEINEKASNNHPLYSDFNSTILE